MEERLGKLLQAQNATENRLGSSYLLHLEMDTLLPKSFLHTLVTPHLQIFPLAAAMQPHGTAPVVAEKAAASSRARPRFCIIGFSEVTQPDVWGSLWYLQARS